MNKKLIPALLLLSLLGMNAYAQQSTIPSNSKEPLEVTADGTLEWDRNNQIFTARENALAKQGATSIKGSILTAKYRDGQKGNMEIYAMTADQNVVIDSKDTKAYGDHAVYELDKSLAVLTGKNLRLISPDQTVTAQERFEYWVNDGRLVAIGAAKMVRTDKDGKTDTLEADTITAYLKQNDKGQRVLDRLEADGNVVITTQTEILYGDHGVYEATPNTAEINGNVKISRGPNVLEGTKATVDLNTNISKLYSGQGKNGRVRGIFYPGTEKTKDPAN